MRILIVASAVYRQIFLKSFEKLTPATPTLGLVAKIYEPRIIQGSAILLKGTDTTAASPAREAATAAVVT